MRLSVEAAPAGRPLPPLQLTERGAEFPTNRTNQRNAIDELRVTPVTRWGTFYPLCHNTSGLKGWLHQPESSAASQPSQPAANTTTTSPT
eukprot:838566-Prorocentrum_minimum.AAC.1